MFTNSLNPFSLRVPLITQYHIVTGLSIVVAFFLVLLILGVRKSYILKKENERLNEMSELQSEKENKVYKDFTEGHMYDKK